MVNRPIEIGESLADLIRGALDDESEIGKRIILNRIASELPPQKPEATLNIVPAMTDQEARTYGSESLPFGKRAGEPIDSVPLSYLVWLADESRQTWRRLHAYLNSPRIKAERDGNEME